MTEAEFSLFFEGANLEKRFIESPVEIKKTAGGLTPQLHDANL
jgi:hypothetical protein